MDDNGNGQKSGMPKLYEIYRRQRQDSDVSMTDCPDIEFQYADSDSYENEIAELYSYTEGPEFQFNLKGFEKVCREAGVLALWQSMTEERRLSLLARITDQMELCNSDARATASRAMLYIAQGCWGEVQSDQEQMTWVRRNCFTLLKCNAWASCIQLLNIEIECWMAAEINNKSQPGAPPILVNLTSASQLRALLSTLYTLVETLRWPLPQDSPKEVAAREAFIAELGMPQEESGELLVVTLLGLVTRFCNASPPHFPIRKLLLLLWKLLLVTLGGTDELSATKAEYRTLAGLAPCPDEDTVTVCRGLRPASPPAPATDLIDQQQHNMVRRRPFRRSLMKQSSLDDSMGDLDLTGDDDNNSGGASPNTSPNPTNPNSPNNSTNPTNPTNPNSPTTTPPTEDAATPKGDGTDSGASDSGIGEAGVSESDCNSDNNSGAGDRPGSPRPSTPALPPTTPPPPPHNKGLPWTPKVRQKDIDCFLDVSRDKFVGFQLPGDRSTLAGLPPPIHEGVHTLSKHIYQSLSEVQMRREDEINRNPLSRPEVDVPQTPAELLYQSLLPSLPQCMIALLKVLLAAAPTSKAKTDSINIMADVLQEEASNAGISSGNSGNPPVGQSMKVTLDINRHKEVLVKAVSATLLLLLKHLKLNHVYQFEFMSQHLVFANCIPLILKFFNQNIMSYVQGKNTIAMLDFPSCVIGDGADLSNEALMATISTAGESKLFDPNSSSLLGGGGDSSPTTSTCNISNNNSPNNNNNNNNNNNASGAATNGGGGSISPSGGGPSNHSPGNNATTSSVCCWRGMFSCINLLRVLNKLCKWKHSRIMMLVVFKSAPILKRTLMVKHAMLQLYVLKLLKMQTKYLGRQWRKSNMKTLSAIYQMVRHRLTDDWAYGNDPDARPWDFQTEECSLRAAVDRFNSRRYHQPHPGDNEFEPVDNCITSVLGRHVELTEEFTRCYEVWLQREVLNTTIHWDLLLSTNTTTGALCAKCTAENNKRGDVATTQGGDKQKKPCGGGGGTSADESEDGKKDSSKGLVCQCNMRFVSDGGEATEYTPLIQQLSGHQVQEQEEEDEYERKERMQTMIKKPNSSIATNGTVVVTVVDISIDDDTSGAMEVDKKPEEQL